MKKDLIRKTDSESGLTLFDRFDVVFNEFDNIFNRFNSIFDGFFTSPLLDLKSSKASFPKINVIENPDSYDVDIAVAGFSKNDISLEIKDNALIISAEKKEEDDISNRRYLCREIAFRSFKRAIPFPSEIDLSSISAKYDNGVIRCHINKVTATEPDYVKIEITE